MLKMYLQNCFSDSQTLVTWGAPKTDCLIHLKTKKKFVMTCRMTKILQINRSFQWNKELPANPVNNESKGVKNILLLSKKNTIESFQQYWSI